MPSGINLIANPDGFRDRFLSLKTRRDVASLLEVDYSLFTYLLYRSDPNMRYRRFEIRKRSGGTRPIMAPNNSLRILQRKLADVLNVVYRPRSSVRGFVLRRGILSNAKMHRRKRFVLNVDLTNFFASINLGRVRGMFMAVPYQLPTEVATTLAQICCFSDQLPQGAPSSPIVSNMLCARMDSQLERLAKRFRCTYSRYADDVTFSTSQSRFQEALGFLRTEGDKQVAEVGPELAGVITSNGFAINPNKVRLSKTGQHQEVTGLVVNRFPNVRRQVVRQVRAMIHALQKFGPEAAGTDHFSRYASPDRGARFQQVSFQEVLYGKLAFVRAIKGKDNPVYVRLAQRLAELYSNVVAGEERTGVSLVENVETRRAARTPQPGGYAHAAG